MKKTAFFASVLFASSSLMFAELYPTRHELDIGLNLDATVSQNTFSVTELLVKELKINLTEMADAMDDDGLIFDMNLSPDFFVDITMAPQKGFGFFAGLDGSMRFSTGKGLWDLLGHGNARDEITSTFSVQGDMFLEAGTKVKFKTGRIGWTTKATYFVPVFYIPHSELKIETITSSPLYMFYAQGKYAFDVYSNFDLNKAFDEDLNFQGAGDLMSSISDDIMDLLSSGGISFELEGEYQLTNTFCMGVFTQIPVIAGKLKYKAPVDVSFNASVIPILDTVDNDDKEFEPEYDYDYSLGDTVKSEYKVRTPFRLGVEGAWRPFGDWCTFRPMLGLAVRNPFGEDYSSEHSIFMEYSLITELNVLWLLKMNFATLYHNQVYTQRFGFGLDLYVFELIANVGVSGASFTKSWNISGINANIGFKFGI